jgi:hypothetical protein
MDTAGGLVRSFLPKKPEETTFFLNRTEISPRFLVVSDWKNRFPV